MSYDFISTLLLYSLQPLKSEAANTDIQKSTWQGHLLSEILISITILQLPIIMSRLIKDNYRAPAKLAEIYLDAQQKPMLIYTKTSYASFDIIIFPAMDGSKIRG